jgi:hypothetical protein
MKIMDPAGNHVSFNAAEIKKTGPVLQGTGGLVIRYPGARREKGLLSLQDLQTNRFLFYFIKSKIRV